MNKLKILIVDDSQNILKLNSLLNNLGLDIHESTSLNKAISLLSRDNFDLCLINIELDINEYLEFSKSLNSNIKNNNMPIIIIGTKEEIDSIREHEFGTENYIFKPVNESLFVRKINSYLLSIKKEREFSYELEKNIVRRTIELEKDIEERKKINEELINVKDELEHENREKSIVLSILRHEIKIPMNGILATIDLLLNDNPQNPYVNTLKIVKYTSENMIEILNHIIELNELEEHKISIENIDFNLHQLISSIKFTMNLKAIEKEIEVDSIIDKRIPEIVKGDPLRIGQIINNLVSNAIKFTDKDKIIIKIDYIVETDESYKILISIIDKGIGISEEQIDKIFKPFSEESNKYVRKGLGLLISNNIAKLMNTKINVISKLNEGSTFFFELCLDKSSKTEIKLETESIFDFGSLKGINVLIVEDNKINQMVSSRFLKKWDIEVDFANDGLIALDKIKTKKYDLVLMDLQMPNMNGYETTRRIRTLDDNYFKQLPIIALTASNISEVEENVIKQGMNSIISKPFNPVELYNTITKYSKKM
ncbi:MAG: response regulator [Candidatus Sericytochromatia bacterium]